MSARTELAELLADELPPEWDVRADLDLPDELEPGRPCLIITTKRVRPGTFGSRSTDFGLWLLDEHTDPQLVEDSLDQRLPVLLGVLDAMPVLAWTEAARGDLLETFAGYEITVTLHHRKG